MFGSLARRTSRLNGRRIVFSGSGVCQAAPMRSPLPFSRPRALVGMVHLQPLPGAPGFDGDLDAVATRAQADARILAEAGFDALMVENFHDTPFFKGALPPITVAALTRCALAVRAAAPDLPLGINALRNDGPAALSVAVATGARFIRVNVLSGAMVTDQGIIEGCAAELLRLRSALGVDIAILADVAVKHAAPLAALDPAQLARDTVYRGHADALVVSGSGTGQPTLPADLEAVRTACPGVPVLVGSGVTAETLANYDADAFIVGTALQKDGRVDRARAEAVRYSSER